MKTCTKCKTEKPLDQFRKHSRHADGYTTWCTPCHSQVNKENYYKNRERRLAVTSAWGKANRERVKETKAVWRENNREKMREYHRQYRLKNPDKAKAALAKWSKNNPDQTRASAAKRRVQKAANGVFEISLKEISKLYRSNCVYCGQSGKMTMDHVIPVSRGGRHSIGNLVPACQSCNFSKHNHTIMEWRLKKLPGKGKHL
jgi:5-methylcytosine-specific restriction endonuclease McrA